MAPRELRAAYETAPDDLLKVDSNLRRDSPADQLLQSREDLSRPVRQRVRRGASRSSLQNARNRERLSTARVEVRQIGRAR